MKMIISYEADDGTRWPSEAACLAYETLSQRVAAIVRPLVEAQPQQDGRYVQLDKEECLRIKDQLVRLIREVYPTEPVFQHNPAKIHPQSYAGRFLSECSRPCLAAAWHYLSCINWGNYRLYSQIYFATNPDKAPDPV